MNVSTVIGAIGITVMLAIFAIVGASAYIDYVREQRYEAEYISVEAEP